MHEAASSEPEALAKAAFALASGSEALPLDGLLPNCDGFEQLKRHPTGGISLDINLPIGFLHYSITNGASVADERHQRFRKSRFGDCLRGGQQNGIVRRKDVQVIL